MNDSMQALGWTLVHFCWQAAAIVLIYRILDLAFARSRSSIRYALALTAMMSMLVVALATFAYEEVRIVRSNAWLRASASNGTQVLPDNLGSRSSASASAQVVANVGSVPGFTRLLTKAIPRLWVRFMPWIDAIWLVGVLALSVRMFGGWLMVRRLRKSTRVEAPASVYAAFVNVSMHLGIRQKVGLFVCNHISGPVAMGVFRSVVLLPFSALTHLSPDQLEVVLAHELAHIRRKDYLWNMIQTIAETLFFFHPAVWWVGSNLRQLRELCCDDVALACCGNPVTFATALLRLEEQRSSGLRLAMAFDGNGSGLSLKTRIVRILDGVSGEAGMRRHEMVPLSLAGVSVVLGLLLMPLPHVFADHSQPAKSQVERKADTNSNSKPAIKAVAAAAGAKRVPIGQELKLEPEAAVIQEAVPSAKQEIAPVPAPQLQPAPNPLATPVVPLASAVLPTPQPTPTASPVPAAAPLSVRPTVSSHPQMIVLSAAVAPMRTVVPSHMTAFAAAFSQQAVNSSPAKEDYINAMRAAGYDDLDKLIAMKVQGITPEYAQRMAQIGYGKPSADDLISLKIFNVTPETVEKLRSAGIAPATVHDLIAYQIFKVTPEFVAGMKDAGFSSIPSNKLISLRVQNVTPEFAKVVRQKYPDVTIDQLVQLRIFRIDDEFIASATSHGFDSLTIEKLVKLRISGLLDDNRLRR